MVTWNTVIPIRSIIEDGKLVNLKYCEGSCLAADTKPTEGIFNGSVLMEMDTSNLYKYDAENEQWRQW